MTATDATYTTPHPECPRCHQPTHPNQPHTYNGQCVDALLRALAKRDKAIARLEAELAAREAAPAERPLAEVVGEVWRAGRRGSSGGS